MLKRFASVGLVVLVGLAVAAISIQPVLAGQAPPAGQGAPAARGAAPTPPCGPNVEMKNISKDSRCFELRTYTAKDPSQFDTLHTRFRDHTNALFKKHGMTIVGFWQPVTKPDTLIYLLAYKDGAARDASWKAFQSDPDWDKVRKALAVGVAVDNVFMVSTDYGPMK